MEQTQHVNHGPDFDCWLCKKHEKDRLTTWVDGPWEAEPENRVEFEHAGLPCILHRGGAGQWCGYVGVSPSHPLYGKSYDEAGNQVKAHGGLTYAEHCEGHICHKPKPGECDDLYWFGWDAGHAGDQTPEMATMPFGLSFLSEMLGDDDFGNPFNDHYWTVDEARE